MSFPDYDRSRRKFLIGGLGVTGALVVGWTLLPPRQRLHASPPVSWPDQHYALNGWVSVAVDGRVTVMLTKSEMGQGVMTSLAMLVADELDVPLSSVDMVQAPLRTIYGDTSMAADGLPFHPDDQGLLKRSAQWISRKLMRELGLMVTGGSSSVKDSWLPMREAGAAARARLVAAAARAWGVPEAECITEQGRVSHSSGRSAAYGELAPSAAAIGDVPYAVKTSDQFRLIGTPAARLDVPAKVNGSAQFGLDIRVEGMRYASLSMCPVFGGTLKSFDGSEVEKLPGVVRVMALNADSSGAGDAVAVVAESRWQAMQAVEQLKVVWEEGANAQLSSESIAHGLLDAVDTENAFSYLQRGDIKAVTGAKRITADYSAPLLAHAAMEPVNATAQFINGRLKLWVPTQTPSLAVKVAARIAGVDEDAVDLVVPLLGGGFGRRLDNDMVAQVVQLARAMEGTPVQLLWSREQDMAHDFYRPAAMVRMTGMLSDEGELVGWDTKSASGAPGQHLIHRAFGLPMMGPDKTTVEGLYDHGYAIPNQLVSHVTVTSEIPLGTWRSVGHSHNAFFKESFIDELAHAAGVDPVRFRRQMLFKHPRHLTVLDAAVKLAGSPAAGHALGVALHQSFGSIVAQVAEVSVEGSQIRVHKVSCVVDCGVVVNPECVRQQIESAIAFGLSAALHDQITISEGRVQQSNFHDYKTLRITDMPEVQVEMITGADAPEGVGEPGTPPIAPAVANAVFKLTGKRLRSLPLRLEEAPSS
ncbi:MAG: hypothetical protein RL369_1017 [Pseudomonadota bacterium]